MIIDVFKVRREYVNDKMKDAYINFKEKYPDLEVGHMAETEDYYLVSVVGSDAQGCEAVNKITGEPKFLFYPDYFDQVEGLVESGKLKWIPIKEVVAD